MLRFLCMPRYWIADVVIRQIEEYHRTLAGDELVSRTPFDGEFRPQLFPGRIIRGVDS